MTRQCLPIPQKLYNITKRLKTPEEEVEKYFPGFLSFIDCIEQQQITRPAIDKKEEKCTIQEKKKIYYQKSTYG